MGGILWQNKKVNLEAEKYYTNIISNELLQGSSPKEQVQLNLSLKEVNSSASSYLISVMMSEDNSNEYLVVGMTNEQSLEYGSNTLTFHVSFILDYFFEKQQNIMFRIRKDSQTFSVVVTLGNIMGSRGQTLVKNISEDFYNKEKLVITCKTLKNNNINLNIIIQVESLLNKNNAIFYILKKGRTEHQNFVNNNVIDDNNYNNSIKSNLEESNYFNVYKSEVINIVNGKGIFNSIKIPSTVLCNGEFDNPILIEFHSLVDHIKIGAHETTVDNLFAKDKNFLIKAAETFKVNAKIDISKEYTFLDYLRGGMQIALSIGIDFTASNGSPNTKNSLHYFDTYHMNSYEKAIRACGDIVAFYDYDQLFPVYGYGAIIKGSNSVSHCFPLNFNLADPNINTINGVLQCYKNSLLNLTLSGPTNFAPLINHVINNVKQEKNQMIYSILMILTDGMISDMDNTIDAVVEASYLPISIIIIGIGQNDFGSMDVLDADDNPLYDKKGRKAARDLVQFVPFYKFQNNEKLLAASVLEEVPRQVIEYYKMINMPPGDPIIINI